MLKMSRFIILFLIGFPAYADQKNSYYIETQFGYGVIHIISEKEPTVGGFGAGINFGTQVDDSSSIEISILKDNTSSASAPYQRILDDDQKRRADHLHIIHFNLLYKKILSTSNDGTFQIYSKLGAGPALYYTETRSSDMKIILPTVLAELGMRYSIDTNITTGFSVALVGLKVFAFGTIAYHWG